MEEAGGSIPPRSTNLTLLNYKLNHILDSIFKLENLELISLFENKFQEISEILQKMKSQNILTNGRKTRVVEGEGFEPSKASTTGS
ncbi:MAG: hypothetical protein ACTSV5_11510 [Promethearchaeota archaeon]